MPFVHEVSLLLLTNSNYKEHVHHTQMYGALSKMHSLEKLIYIATYGSSSHNLIINEIHRTICVGEGYGDRCSQAAE